MMLLLNGWHQEDMTKAKFFISERNKEKRSKEKKEKEKEKKKNLKKDITSSLPPNKSRAFFTSALGTQGTQKVESKAKKGSRIIFSNRIRMKP